MSEKFSRNLKSLRNRRNLSQDDLAKELQLSRSTVTKYETGEREPDFQTLEKISVFFGVSIDFLLGNQVNYQRFDNSAKEDTVLYDNKSVKPEHISDECALEAARIIAREGTDLNREERSFLLNMIKTYIVSAKNEKRKNTGKKRRENQEKKS